MWDRVELHSPNALAYAFGVADQKAIVIGVDGSGLRLRVADSEILVVDVPPESCRVLAAPAL
jgi:hypothetical protein